MADLTSLLKPVTTDEMVSNALALLEAAEFPTTSWHSTSIPRSLIEFEAAQLSDLTGTVALIAAGGVLDLAEGDWLKLLCKDFFDEDPKPAITTVGSVTLTDAAGTLNTYGASELVFIDNATGRVFRNVNAVTIPASSSTTFAIQAEAPGVVYNVQGGSMTIATPIPGVTLSITAGVGWITTSGADEEDDISLRARCKLKWGTLTGNGPSDAYKKNALDASSEINRVVVLEDPLAVPPLPSVTVLVATTAGAPSAGAFDAAATAVEAKRPLGIVVQTIGASNLVYGLYGTVRVKKAQRATAEALISDRLTTFFAGANQKLNDDTLEGLTIGPTTLKIAQLGEILMSPAGVSNASVTDSGGTVLRPIADDVALSTGQVATLENHLTYVEI